MLEAAEVERKIREIILFIDMQVNISVFSATIVMRLIMNWKCIIYTCAKGKQIMAAEKMW